MSLTTRKYLSVLSAIVFWMLSVPAYAGTSFNFGFNLGTAKIEADQNSFNDGSLGYTKTTDPDTYSWSIYGETSFNRYMRMEFGLIDGGFATMEGFSNGFGTYWWYGPVSADYGVAAIKVGLVGVLPLDSNDRFKLLAKVGLAPWATVVTLKDSYSEETEVDSGMSPYYGFGAELDLTDLIALRLQHEAFSVSASSDWLPNGYDFNYSNTTLGLLFRF